MNYRLSHCGVAFFLVLTMSSCATVETAPQNTENLCALFAEKTDWRDENEAAFKKWAVPIHVQMAIMWQESHFVADAQPPRGKILGIIPSFRPSSAYGYAQALDGTWQHYQKNTAQPDAERSDFAQACDFIGWYCDVAHKELGISKWDVYNLYLAYHEGNAGYKRKTYLSKPWLLTVAKKVSNQANYYRQQLENCQN